MTKLSLYFTGSSVIDEVTDDDGYIPQLLKRLMKDY